jgi:hypothetical protein
MAGVDQWTEIDALIAEGREVHAVRAIWKSRGCSLQEAYRMFGERVREQARRDAGAAEPPV